MKALKIFIPACSAPEAVYSFEILFNGIHFSNYVFIEKNDIEDFVITTCDEKEIVTIANHFFKKEIIYHEDLIPENVKQEIIQIDNKSHQVISLFGNAVMNDDRLELDIVSSTFFMTTRWEEQVLKTRDIHGRFDEHYALSVKENFIQRPVINEYALLLKDILLMKGVDTGSWNIQTDISVTFDIDYIFKWKYWKSLPGNLLRSGPDLIDKIKYIGSFLQTKIGGFYQRDPFYSFDYLFKILEGHNLKSVFYFMVAKTSTLWDLNDYQPEDKVIRDVLSKMKEKGHVTGLHSSYHAVENFEQLQLEKKKLEDAAVGSVEFIRPHYLRIIPESSLQLIHKAGFKKESSMLYSRQFGFRCGCTFAIPFFNIKTRQKTDLMMIPTIAMSSAGIDTEYKTQSAVMKVLIQTMKHYGGQAQIIWHNSDFDTAEKKKYFEEIIKMIAE